MAGSKPSAGILDRDKHAIRLRGCARDRQYFRAVGDLRHGVHGVRDQVQQHLLELHLVAQNRLQMGGQVGVQRHAVPLQVAAGERQHFLDGVVEVELRQLRPGFHGERPQAVDHVARAVGILHDARDRLPRRIKIGRVPAQPAQAGIAAGGDGGQRLVDLMRDRGGQLAQGRQAGRMREVRLRLMQAFLGTFGRGDVHHRADEFQLVRLIA